MSVATAVRHVKPARVPRVGSNTLAQLASYALGWGAKAAVAAVVARMLGSSGLGSYWVGWTIASVVAQLAPLGLGTLLVRESNRRVPLANTGSAFACTGALTLGWMAVLSVASLGAGSYGGALRGAALYVAFAAPALVLRAAFHGRERMTLETVAVATEAAVSIVVATLAVRAGFGVGGALAGLAAGAAANLAVSLVMHHRSIGRLRIDVRPGTWPSMLATSAPMGLAYLLATSVLRLDVIVLAVFRPQAEVGRYGAASTVVSAVAVIATAYTGSLYPRFSRWAEGDPSRFDASLQAATRRIAVVAIVTAALLAVAASPIVTLAWGSSLRQAAPLLVALAVVLPFRSLCALFGAALNASDAQATRARVLAGALATNVLGCLLLVPRYGAWGAVIASVLTEVPMCLVLARAARAATRSQRTAVPA